MARPRTDIAPRIIAAARAQFLKDGVGGASLRTIATRAKTNVGMVYYYFRTKDDLFFAVVEDIYAGLLRDLEAAVSGPGTIRDHLRGVSVRMGSITDKELEVLRLVLGEALLGSARFRRLFARFREGHIGLLMGVMAKGARDGEVDKDIPLPLLLLATFGLVGLPQFVRRMAPKEMPLGARFDAQALAHLGVEVLFRGVAAPKRRALTKRRKGAAPDRGKRGSV